MQTRSVPAIHRPGVDDAVSLRPSHSDFVGAEARTRAYKAFGRVLKLAGSMVYFGFSSLHRGMQRSLLRRPFPGMLVVLCYHAVPRSQRGRFARQMDLLLSYAAPVRLDRDVHLSAGEICAAVSFDDGYQSTLENALPELAARNIPSTIFVVSAMMGQTPSWAGSDGYDSEETFLTEEQLTGLSRDLITVGSHTMTHPNLAALSESDAKAQLEGSRTSLEQILGSEVRLFAFPHGHFHDSLVDWCRDVGYQQVFSIEPTTTCQSLPLITGRVITDPTDWEIEFRLKILGAYSWLATVYRIKKRIRRLLKLT